MPRRLLFALVAVAGCAPRLLIPAAPGVSPQLRPESPRAPYYNAPAALPQLGAFERDLIGRIEAHRRARGRPAVSLDAGLSVVAREYVREALRMRTKPPARLIDFLLHHAGITEPHPIVFHATFPAEIADDFPSRFELQLDRLFSSSATDFGLSALIAGGSVGVSVIVLDRAARLAPLPQTLEPGAVVPVSGKLSSTHRDPVLMVTTPRGGFRQVELSAPNGAFASTVALDDGPGTYTVEVVAVGPLGPTVVSLFPLYAGVSPPTRLESLRKVVETPADPQRAEAILVELVNEERVRRRLPPLQASERLAAIARAHSLDMQRSGFVGHRSPTSGMLTDRLKSAGLLAEVSLENIARNDTLAGAHHGLMSSPGHRRNILDPRVREIGIGVVYAGLGAQREVFVTQDFFLPVAIVDPRVKQREIWDLVQERRRQGGLPALDRDLVLEQVATEMAGRVLRAGSIDSVKGEELIAARLRTRGYAYRQLTAQFLVARGADRPSESVAWTRSGNWRAGIGVAQEAQSAFGEYALCLVVLMADGRNP